MTPIKSDSEVAEYIKKSDELKIQRRCPIINHCTRRSDTIGILNNIPKDKRLGFADIIPPIIESVGDTASICHGATNFLALNLCPEVSLFETSLTISDFGGKPVKSGEYDKYNEGPKTRILTGHYSDCREYIFNPQLITEIQKSKLPSSKSIATNLDITKITNLLTKENTLSSIIIERHNELINCMHHESYFAAIILSGSLLETILLAIARENKALFISSNYAPRNRSGKCIKPLEGWSLHELIIVSEAIGYLSLDTSNFTHTLRNFRNYIHPYTQEKNEFSPRKETAELCLHVIKSAINDLYNKSKFITGQST